MDTSGLGSLELVDSVKVSDKGTRSISGNESSSLEVSRSEELLELGLEEIISSWKRVSLSKFEGKSNIVSDMSTLVHDVRDKVVLINIDGQHLSVSVDSDGSSGLGVSYGGEDPRIGDSLSEDEGSRSGLEHVEISKLGDDIDDTVFLHRVDDDGEISLNIRRIGELSSSLELGGTGGGVSDLHNMDTGGGIRCLLLDEGEQLVSV